MYSKKYRYLFDSLVGILYSCLSLVEVLVDLREIISSAVVYYETNVFEFICFTDNMAISVNNGVTILVPVTYESIQNVFLERTRNYLIVVILVSTHCF